MGGDQGAKGVTHQMTPSWNLVMSAEQPNCSDASFGQFPQMTPTFGVSPDVTKCLIEPFGEICPNDFWFFGAIQPNANSLHLV